LDGTGWQELLGSFKRKLTEVGYVVGVLKEKKVVRRTEGRQIVERGEEVRRTILEERIS
jgi:hypothetical protein